MTGTATKDSQDSAGSVLRRKLGRAAQPVEAAPGRRTVERALGIGLARAADQQLGCALGLLDMAGDAAPLDTLSDDLPEPGLLAMLDCLDGRIGIVALCAQLTAGVVEAQTMGRVLPGEAPARRATSTDGAIAAGFLDAVIAGTVSMAAGLPEAQLLTGMHYVRVWPDARAAGLALRDTVYRRWTVKLELAGGAKTGVMVLAVPGSAPAADTTAPASAQWDRQLRQAVLDSPARLEAVLTRLRLPLRQVAGWAVGDVVQLTGARLSAVELLGADGTTTATARLGRAGEQKAVRIAIAQAPRMDPPAPIAAPTAAPEPEQTD